MYQLDEQEQRLKSLASTGFCTRKLQTQLFLILAAPALNAKVPSVGPLLVANSKREYAVVDVVSVLATNGQTQSLHI